MPIMSSDNHNGQDNQDLTQPVGTERAGSVPTQSPDVENLSSTHYLVAEEYTVGVPLIRPKANFLEILKSAGATGEIFTKKEICHFLKTYISTKKLYDVQDPRIVYCKKDPLGKVFGVNKFTIDDVINLINQNCNQVPDTCIKRKRHLVARPKEVIPQSANASNVGSNQIVTTVANTPSSLTIEVCRASPVVSSTSGTHTSSASRRKSPKLQSDPRQKTSSAISTEKSNDAKKSDDTAVHRRKRKQSTDTKSSGSSESKRGRSLSITYSDVENASYPWYFQLRMETDDESEVLSIQEKETVPVEDSTDDLWFVEDESLAVDEDAFSLEYELESDNTEHLSESDSSIYFSGKDVLVVCKDSDIEFWADSSGDETDNELTDGDKWICSECKTSNSPLQRYCVRCWKLRPGWLPENSIKKLPLGRRKVERSASAPGYISSSESGSTVLESPRKRSPGKYTRRRSQTKFKVHNYDSDSSVDRRGYVKERDSVKFESLDSGIYTSSTQPSSQEIVVPPKSDTAVKKLFEEISFSTDDLKGNVEQLNSDIYLGVRRTCLNYQSNTGEHENVKLTAEERTSNLSNLGKNSVDINDVNKSDDIKIKGKEIKAEHFKCENTQKSDKSFLNIEQKTGLTNSSSSEKELSSLASKVLNSNKSLMKEGVLLTKTSSMASGSGIQIGGDNCVICMARPKTGSIIHGSTGHQVCCYKCARRLKRQRKPCPVCRRPINKVVKNFIL